MSAAKVWPSEYSVDTPSASPWRLAPLLPPQSPPGLAPVIYCGSSYSVTKFLSKWPFQGTHPWWQHKEDGSYGTSPLKWLRRWHCSIWNIFSPSFCSTNSLIAYAIWSQCSHYAQLYTASFFSSFALFSMDWLPQSSFCAAKVNLLHSNRPLEVYADTADALSYNVHEVFCPSLIIVRALHTCFWSI